MSKGVRELHDLIQAVNATPGWEVEEKPREWHVYAPLSDRYVIVKKMAAVPAHQLRTIGSKLEKAGWTKEAAEKAIKAAARQKTEDAREKAELKAAKLLGEGSEPAEPEQAVLPLYQAAVVGDASHLPPGPLDIDDVYSIDSVLLTPELAEKFLSINIENNRHASKTNYGDIAADIRGGRWKRNGDRIRFARVKDAQGKWVHRLIDGQKRCLAVIEAGVAIPVDLIYNLDRDAFPTIDIQQSRNGAQTLHMRGVSNPFMISAGIKVVWQYDQKSWSTRVTNPHLNELYDLDPQGWQSAARFITNQMQKTARLDRGMFAQRCLLGAYYVCRRAYPTNPRLGEFFEPLILGLELSGFRDPRFKLRKLFADEQDLGVRKNTKRHLAMILKAYNGFMTDTAGPVTWQEPQSVPDPVMGA